MTARKPPTPQAISRILSRAGFPRSVFTGPGRTSRATRARGYRERSDGYHVSAGSDGEVTVRYKTSGRAGGGHDEVARAIQLYRETLAAVGYRVRTDEGLRLIVTAPAPDGES